MKEQLTVVCVKMHHRLIIGVYIMARHFVSCFMLLALQQVSFLYMSSALSQSTLALPDNNVWTSRLPWLGQESNMSRTSSTQDVPCRDDDTNYNDEEVESATTED